MARTVLNVARTLLYVVGAAVAAVLGLFVLIAAGVWAYGEVLGVMTHVNMAWVDSTIRQGMTRAQVYNLLRGRGLQAYWSLDYRYTLDTDDGRKCASALYKNRYFPKMDRSLPPVCANPVVGIEYQLYANLACGTWTYQTFSFDDYDRLIYIKDGGQYTACL
jgi:hypothetical protein